MRDLAAPKCGFAAVLPSAAAASVPVGAGAWVAAWGAEACDVATPSELVGFSTSVPQDDSGREGVCARYHSEVVGGWLFQATKRRYAWTVLLGAHAALGDPSELLVEVLHSRVSGRKRIVLDRREVLSTRRRRLNWAFDHGGSGTRLIVTSAVGGGFHLHCELMGKQDWKEIHEQASHHWHAASVHDVLAEPFVNIPEVSLGMTCTQSLARGGASLCAGCVFGCDCSTQKGSPCSGLVGAEPHKASRGHSDNEEGCRKSIGATDANVVDPFGSINCAGGWATQQDVHLEIVGGSSGGCNVSISDCRSTSSHQMLGSASDRSLGSSSQVLAIRGLANVKEVESSLLADGATCTASCTKSGDFRSLISVQTDDTQLVKRPVRVVGLHAAELAHQEVSDCSYCMSLRGPPRMLDARRKCASSPGSTCIPQCKDHSSASASSYSVSDVVNDDLRLDLENARLLDELAERDAVLVALQIELGAVQVEQERRAARHLSSWESRGTFLGAATSTPARKPVASPRGSATFAANGCSAAVALMFESTDCRRTESNTPDTSSPSAYDIAAEHAPLSLNSEFVYASSGARGGGTCTSQQVAGTMCLPGCLPTKVGVVILPSLDVPAALGNHPAPTSSPLGAPAAELHGRHAPIEVSVEVVRRPPSASPDVGRRSARLTMPHGTIVGSAPPEVTPAWGAARTSSLPLAVAWPRQPLQVQPTSNFAPFPAAQYWRAPTVGLCRPAVGFPMPPDTHTHGHRAADHVFGRRYSSVPPRGVQGSAGNQVSSSGLLYSAGARLVRSGSPWNAGPPVFGALSPTLGTPSAVWRAI